MRTLEDTSYSSCILHWLSVHKESKCGFVVAQYRVATTVPRSEIAGFPFLLVLGWFQQEEEEEDLDQKTTW